MSRGGDDGMLVELALRTILFTQEIRTVLSLPRHKHKLK